MTDWSHLDDELDAWTQAGQTATFWWRDDDAQAPTPALERLLSLAREAAAPLALAVVPAEVDDALGALLAAATPVSILQHGYAHQNHAGPQQKKMELGPHRPFETVIAEIAVGWQRLDSLSVACGLRDRLLAVMVPPWNRIAPQLVPMLPEIRFAGLSTFGPRGRAEAVRGLHQVNTHIDVIDWAGTRGFVGTRAALDQAISHLARRRMERGDAAEPTGLLTHHLAHDEATWDFVATFLDRIAKHDAARMVSAHQAFGMTAP